MEKRPCPFCAEDVAVGAARCPHCRSRLLTFDPAAWYRDHPERKLAGVAAAVSHALALPVGVVRVAFVVATVLFLHLLGPLLYGLLWALVPYRPDDEPLLERALGKALATLRQWRTGDDLSGPTPGTWNRPAA